MRAWSPRLPWIILAILAVFLIVIAILAIGPRREDHIFIVITAWSTAILAVVTLIAMMYQAEIARRGSELSILIALTNEWDSPRMGERRLAVADWVRTGSNMEDPAGPDVLDFLESIALYANRRYVSIDLIDSQFGWSILHFWAVLSDHVAAMRKEYRDPSLYCETEALVTAIRLRSQGNPLSEAELRASFLKAESGEQRSKSRRARH